MSKRVKNTSVRKMQGGGFYSGRWSKASNNAKCNKHVNQGTTAAINLYCMLSTL